MKDNTFLTRWGHTATVYERKIYVFGGRFCNDLNDILVLDPNREQVTTLKVHGDVPKARRRHSACFLGSCMLIFGGFNGEYFNDLHYINTPSSKKRLSVNINLNDKSLSVLSKIQTVDFLSLKSNKAKELQVCKGLIAPRFNSI
jgi:N-acetylneuraminic acid mutarotase